MGTPEFAVPSLDLIARTHEVVDVVTQPDRPRGRGQKLQPPTVKRRALELGLRVHQPARIRGEESLARLTDDGPDVIVVVGYGQMIPKRIREIGVYGCVNVHSSLLPKYRGAAPVNWALVRGETRTGVTTMRLVREMDAGDILLARETEIGPHETASELNRRLAPIGAELLLETLASLASGTVRPKPQDHSAATRAPLIKKEDGLVYWSWSAQSIYNRLRGFDPWPGIYSFFRGRRLRILAARPESDGGIEPGRVVLSEGRVCVGCGTGRLVLEQVQIEGRKRVSALDFARGSRPAPDEVLKNE